MTVTEPTSQRRRRPSGGAAATWGVLSPPLLWIVVFFVVPVVMIAIYSVGGISGLSPNDIPRWTVTPWKDFNT